MRFAVLVLLLMLCGCATPRECVEWDMRNPIQITIPLSGMMVARTVYPCVREAGAWARAGQ